MGFTALKKDTKRLTRFHNGREKVYASTVVWLGKNLPEGYSQIAANEIGTIGFFARPQTKIIDMLGILRSKKEKSIYFIQLLQRHRPIAVLTKKNFKYKKAIDKHLKNNYTWIRFKHLQIGLRNDIAFKMKSHLPKLRDIYKHIDVNREYPWQ